MPHLYEHLRQTSERRIQDMEDQTQHLIAHRLDGIIGMTGLLRVTALTSQQQQCAETVRSSGETLLKVINDIMDVSKIEAGKFEFEIIPFDLQTTVEETLEL